MTAETPMGKMQSHSATPCIRNQCKFYEQLGDDKFECLFILQARTSMFIANAVGELVERVDSLMSRFLPETGTWEDRSEAPAAVPDKPEAPEAGTVAVDGH